MKTLQDVADSQWVALANTKIYFGHQSVGGNILDGVQQLLTEHPGIPLRVVQSDAPSEAAGGTLVHSRIGQNGDPAGKARDFAARMARGLGPGGGIAMFKLCYVDFTPETDVQAVFQAYRENVEQVRAAHPDVRIVHVTTPLVVRQQPLKDLVRRLLGRASYAKVDAARIQYNRLLLAEYGGKDAVFDLARLEATRADGSLEAYGFQGDTVWNLVPDFTDDGAHLNTVGRRRVAEQLLVFLASLETRPAQP
jgi:hypothetical protein